LLCQMVEKNFREARAVVVAGAKKENLVHRGIMAWDAAEA
jgi:hypothetical protein